MKVKITAQEFGEIGDAISVCQGTVDAMGNEHYTVELRLLLNYIDSILKTIDERSLDLDEESD